MECKTNGNPSTQATAKCRVTTHAAIVSRELAIPCIVGTETATKVMEIGKQYTVDSRNGIVYEGVLADAAKPSASKGTAAGEMRVIESVPVTATKIYMNLGVPQKIADYKDLPYNHLFSLEHPNSCI